MKPVHLKINCSTYLYKLCQAHGWNKISNKPIEPISLSRIKELKSTESPPVTVMVSNFKFLPLESFEEKYPILEDPFLVSDMYDVSLAPKMLMRCSELI